MLGIANIFPLSWDCHAIADCDMHQLFMTERKVTRKRFLQGSSMSKSWIISLLTKGKAFGCQMCWQQHACVKWFGKSERSFGWKKVLVYLWLYWKFVSKQVRKFMKSLVTKLQPSPFWNIESQIAGNTFFPSSPFCDNGNFQMLQVLPRKQKRRWI